MKKYQKELANLYTTVILESPDNIEVGDKYYSYSSTPNAYTGLIDLEGHFIISKQIVGHGSLIRVINGLTSENYDETMTLIKTNVTKVHDLQRMAREYNKVRVWSGQKVFSMWDDYRPQYKESIIKSIQAVGHDPMNYKYDSGGRSLPYEEMTPYDEFFVDKLSDEEQAEIHRKEQEKREAERLLADKLAGANRPKRTIDYDILPQRQPAWMTRDGD